MSDINWDKENFEKLIIERDSWLQENGKYRCPICDKESSKIGIRQHIERVHFGRPGPTSKLKGYVSWAKGLTKETDVRIRKGAETQSRKYKSGELVPGFKGKTHTKEARNKLSDSMKKRHINGELNGWISARKYGKVSYPENFFMKIIKSEFIDKHYKYEYSFYQYSLDFAWVHLKKCIEIDGEQHYQYQDRIESDIKKDTLLRENDWKVLRIRWKDMYKEPKRYIKIAKDFIDNDIEHLEDNLKKYYDEIKKLERIKKQKELDKINNLHEIAIKVNKIIDSDIDFTKFGWVNKVNQITDQPNGRRWIKRWCPWLLENTFKKSGPVA